MAVDAICSNEDNGIWTIPMAGGPPHKTVGENAPGATFADALQYWHPAWTPDSAAILYQRSELDPSGHFALAVTIRIARADGLDDEPLLPDHRVEPSVARSATQ